MQKSDQEAGKLEKTSFPKDPTHHDYYPFEHHHRLMPRHYYEHDVLAKLRKEGYWGDSPSADDPYQNDISSYLDANGCNIFQHGIIAELKEEGLWNG